MTSSLQVIYHPEVLRKDLSRISHRDRKRIRKAIESKLMIALQEFGEPLRRTLKGYWKLRVGDYRIIYKLNRTNIIVLRIGHRSDAYKAVRGF